MKKLLAALFLAVSMAALTGFSGCAGTTGTSMTLPASTGTPEQQIATAANAETAAIGLATALLKNDKITTTQAKSYSGMLHAASSALNDANATLLACRKTTGSTSATNPDPCAFGVADVIKIATTTISGVQAALSAK